MPSKVDISVASTAGLVSIVMPCCGMLEYTRLGVPSLLRHTKAPFELIFLDVGSLDGTAEYLGGLQAGLLGRARVEVVRTPNDLGLKDACKEALRQTLGEYVVLLNNDTVVTPGWLERLISLVSLSPGVGMTGPMSNYAAPPQLVETVPYRTFSTARSSVASASGLLVEAAAVEKFALEFQKQNQGQWTHAERLGGFCLLLKREVLDKIGDGLDRHPDLGLFDTDILSTKAMQAGYTLAVCKDLFVHHFGTRTFAHSAKATPASPLAR
jgi:O-antigen biosynthesis protein